MSIVEKAVDKHLGNRGEKAAPPKPPANAALSDEDGVRLLPVEEPGAGADDHGRTIAPTAEGEPSDVLHLDFDELRESSIVPPEDFAPNLANEFRRIKRPLLRTAFGKSEDQVPHGNLIMLCSALSGEGKTFTTVNLAMSIALERERTVLLIDADVAKPHITRALGLEDRRGLMDVLVDKSLDIADVLVQTDMPGLRVLPAGQRHEYATELLASERMEEVIGEIAGRYPNRVILLDSPPLLQTSEAQVISGLAGQIVVVVHAGSTPQSALENALRLIDPSKHVSLVLNKCRVSSGGDHYYGGYYGQDT